MIGGAFNSDPAPGVPLTTRWAGAVPVMTMANVFESIPEGGALQLVPAASKPPALEAAVPGGDLLETWPAVAQQAIADAQETPGGFPWWLLVVGIIIGMALK